MLGTNVGHTVKPSDAMEGETVGIEVNCGVGLNVGVNVGASDGRNVGEGVGMLDGV